MRFRFLFEDSFCQCLCKILPARHNYLNIWNVMSLNLNIAPQWHSRDVIPCVDLLCSSRCSSPGVSTFLGGLWVCSAHVLDPCVFMFSVWGNRATASANFLYTEKICFWTDRGEKESSETSSGPNNTSPSSSSCSSSSTSPTAINKSARYERGRLNCCCCFNITLMSTQRNRDWWRSGLGCSKLTFGWSGFRRNMQR